MRPIRSRQLRVRVTSSERAAAEAIAERQGIPLSDVVRILVRQEAKRLHLWPPEVRDA